MRRKDDEKPMGPMFPRLHVNDTETGGPRAPPRNKMALYEQLSIPSQRFNSGVSPLKPNSNNHVLPPSPSQFPPSAPKSHLEKLSKSGSSTLSRVTSLQHNASAEDDFAVPIFIDSALVHCLVTPTVSNNTSLSKRIQRDNGNDPGVDGRSQTAIEPSKIMSYSGLGERCPESLPEVDGFDEASEKIKSYKAARLQSENVSRDFGPEETLSSRENDMGPPSIQIDPSSGETQCINDGEYLSDERSNDGSYASNVDAISAVDISPDDAVGIIGQKHFRKARKAIVNQQRVFAVQVFELHRLITVQRLIAASPNLLLDDALAVTKPPSRTTSPAETVAALEDSDNSPASPSIIVKQHPTRQSHPAEFSAENAVRKPMTAANRSMTPGTAPPPDTWTGPWGEGPNSAPSPNQWLVPMMSPTEGLVYKACPSPMFGSCATSALMGSNFTNPQFGGVLSYPPQPFFLGGFLHSYFPPYGSKPPMMPIPVPPKQGGSERLNSSQPASTVLTGETNHAPTQREAAAAAAASAGSKRIRISRESDFQGSISDSPFKKVKAGLDQPNHDQQNQSSCDSDHGFGADRDDGSKSGVVSLFLDGDCTSRVIKAVPHNPKSASESVARIFRFIQKERKQ